MTARRRPETPAAPLPWRSPSRRDQLGAGLLLAILALGVYSNSLDAAFTYDSVPLILQDPRLGDEVAFSGDKRVGKRDPVAVIDCPRLGEVACGDPQVKDRHGVHIGIDSRLLQDIER